MTDLIEEHLEEEKETKMSKSSRFVLQIAGAALFSALSLIFSVFVTPYLPQTPEGFAYFDPVSIIWVTCYLIFGPLAGILCCGVGSLALMPFDDWTPIGPLMKLAATLSLIIIPILILRFTKRDENIRKSQILKKPKNYIIYGLLGTVFRIVVMLILNIVLYLMLYGTGGLEIWIVTVIVLNALTSLWDLLFPYLIVFVSKIDIKFEIW
ncbi:MAG: ECF transporter S component [Candidatus Hermodarchaeota archaeon]